MTGVSPAHQGFLLTLVGGILAVTFVPLGIVFTIIGAVESESIVLGLVLLAVGVLIAGVALYSFGSGRARARREEAARISHGTAQVVEAKHNWGSQIGARHPLKLTVELSGGRHTRNLLVPSHVDWKPGETIAVLYAPEDPGNFVPS